MAFFVEEIQLVDGTQRHQNAMTNKYVSLLHSDNHKFKRSLDIYFTNIPMQKVFQVKYTFKINTISLIRASM